MNKRKVGADGELFSLDFPVAIPNVQKNPVHLVKMNLETPMISSLKEIIRSHGDEQQHASNVKADMTDWFMQDSSKGFQWVCNRDMELAAENNPHDLDMIPYDFLCIFQRFFKIF